MRRVQSAAPHPPVGHLICFFFFSSRRRHTRFEDDWSSDVCSSDLERVRLYWQKFGLGYGPSALLGLVALALGGGAVGWVILIFGALLGLFVASSARKVRGAAIGGGSGEGRGGEEGESRGWPDH